MLVKPFFQGRFDFVDSLGPYAEEVRPMTYHPIQNYGIIGNMRTAALVSMEGSIDWFCFPHFDSPSVFAAILDHDKGGRFEIASTHEGSGPSSSTGRTRIS